MIAYFCDFCEKVTAHETFSFHQWQKLQTENTMERSGTELLNLMGVYKLGDIAFSIFGADQYQCQGCSAIVRPKKSLRHYFYIPNGVSKKNSGKTEGYGGFFYLEDIADDEESLEYLRMAHNRNLLVRRRS